MPTCDQLTVLILTYNEEVNLPVTLASVCGWAGHVAVVDSFSTDKTVEIAADFDVPVYQNHFEHWASQRNWGFDNVPINTEWVLWLDADEQVTPELAQEITEALTMVEKDVAGFYMDRHFFFMGRWLKWGGYAPNWVLRLCRPDRTRLIPAGDREYFRIDGEARYLKGYLHHEDPPRFGVLDSKTQSDFCTGGPIQIKCGSATQFASTRWVVRGPFSQQST